jgi:choline dehydrogenase-like flavoprotein
MEGVLALAKICYITGATEIHAYLPGLEPFVRQRERQDSTSSTSTAVSSSAQEEKLPQPPPAAFIPKKTNTAAYRPQVPKQTIDLGITDPAFSAWLARVRAVGNKPPHTCFTSAHQMGSCRMSSHPGDGVVDGRGRVWGVENLLVADASVFPSASGVNPMVTNMAIADWIARGVVSDLGGVVIGRRRG